MHPMGPLIDLLLDEHRERVTRAVRQAALLRAVTSPRTVHRSAAPLRGRAVATPAGCLS